MPLRLFMFNNEPLSFLPPSRLLSSLLLCFSPFLPLVRGDAPSQEAVRSRGSEPAWVAETPGLCPALPRAASRQSPRRRPLGALTRDDTRLGLPCAVIAPCSEGRPDVLCFLCFSFCSKVSRKRIQGLPSALKASHFHLFKNLPTALWGHRGQPHPTARRARRDV